MEQGQSHTGPLSAQHVEFWRLKRVCEVTGISKSEIYRQIADGRFPQPKNYRDSPGKKFWLSTQIKDWQRQQLNDDDFGDLL